MCDADDDDNDGYRYATDGGAYDNDSISEKHQRNMLATLRRLGSICSISIQV